jgi:sterol 24-C-methyltransferase
MKVLKPGGIVSTICHSDFISKSIAQFGVYEWCMTDAWDPSNPVHKEIAHGIEVGDGIPEMRTIQQARQALKNVGFDILHEEDLAARPDEIPWYYPLEGDIRKAQTAWDYLTVWRMSWSGKLVTQTAVKLLETAGLVPKGTFSVGEALKTASIALVRGGQEKVSKISILELIPILIIRASQLFTPMYLAISRKPK